MPLNYSVVLVVVWKKGEPRVRDAGVAADERKLAFLYHNGGGVEPWDGETCAKTLANFALLVARGWTFGNASCFLGDLVSYERVLTRTTQLRTYHTAHNALRARMTACSSRTGTAVGHQNPCVCMNDARTQPRITTRSTTPRCRAFIPESPGTRARCGTRTCVDAKRFLFTLIYRVHLFLLMFVSRHCDLADYSSMIPAEKSTSVYLDLPVLI